MLVALYGYLWNRSAPSCPFRKARVHLLLLWSWALFGTEHCGWRHSGHGGTQGVRHQHPTKQSTVDSILYFGLNLFG